MNYIQIPDYAFNRIIKTLQSAYDICNAVDYDSEETEKSPCYATGYSRATMQSVLEDLNRYKESSK
jgi:hypothetical protein